jgi:putative acetyltransferase
LSTHEREVKVRVMPRIRRARREDGAAIYEAHAAAIRVTCRSHYADADIEAWAGRLGPESYGEDIERRDILVAEEVGRVLGFGVLDAEESQVRAVYVHPQAGRCGVGARLLAVLETIARLRGVTELHLDSSLNAVAFYAAAGWRRRDDTIHTFPGGHDIPCVVMTKTVSPVRLAIRDETPADVAAIRTVERLAFERDGEADLVDRLRAAGALSLSLVATLDEDVVGHVAFSPVVVRDASIRMLGLAPVAVRSEYQRCAIGARLVEEGLARAREQGIDAVVVLGHPQYYPRFGFVAASRFGLRYPGSVPDEAFMAAELVPHALARVTGPVHYHAAFDALTE